MWLNNLRTMKAESKLTTKEIALQSGIPEPTLEKIFAGKTKDPKLETIRQLVHFFGHTLDDLIENPIRNTSIHNEFSDSELQHMKKYRALDPYGKDMVDAVLEHEYKRSQEQKQVGS